MQEGIFVLSTTIRNPRPDRRVKDSWLSAVEWKKGSRYAIVRAKYVEKETLRRHGERVQAFELKSLDYSYSGGHVLVLVDEKGKKSISGWDEKMEPALLELAASLYLSTDRSDELLFVFIARSGYSVSREAQNVLFRLYAANKVSMDQIVAALAAEDAEAEAEQAREEAERAAKKLEKA